MPELRNDILVKIPDEDLPKLAALYEEKATWAPYMVSFLHTAMKWKKSDKYKEVMNFLSPNNSWYEDGTIIVIITIVSAQDIVVFTLDEQCTNLYKGLVETNLISYTDKRTWFFAVHEKHIPTVQKYALDKTLNISFDKPSFSYVISPEEARNFIIECPADVYIKKLKPSDAKQISDAWPHNFPNSEPYLATYISANGGYGLYLKKNDEMAAWIIKYVFGHLAILQTEDKHKRKGYATLVIKALSKEIADEGHWPFYNVLHSNEISINVIEKLGFHCIGSCTFLKIDK